MDDDEIGARSQEVVNPLSEPVDLHPWVVDIGGCHGVLIHPRWVLTAAHCLQDVGKISPTFTAPPNTDARQTRIAAAPTLDNIYLHPDYHLGFVSEHDVALVRLDRSFQLDSRVHTIYLPDMALPAGHRVRYGSTEDHTDNAILEGMLAVFEGRVESCSEGPGNICVRSEEQAACSGDSGSGVVAVVVDGQHKRAVVTGIASYAFGCESGGRFVAADVLAHDDWIRNTVTARGDNLNHNVTLRRIGLESDGVMRLSCHDDFQQPIWVEARMNVPGLQEVKLACGASSVVEATCDLRGLPASRQIREFLREFQTTEILPHSADLAHSWEYVAGGVLPRAYECHIDLHSALYAVFL